MESIQKIYSKKYETLASIMADYLESLLYSKESNNDSEIEGSNKETIINIHQLKLKDIKEWNFDEMEVIVHLLLTQIKPFLSVKLFLRRKQVL